MSNVSDLIKEIYELQQKLKSLEDQLYNEMSKERSGNTSEVKTQILVPATNSESQDTLEVMGLSQKAIDCLKRHGIQYFYDLGDDVIQASRIRSWVGNDFKMFREIVEKFIDWGVHIDKDIPCFIEDKKPQIAEKYRKPPYTIKVKSLEKYLDKKTYNAIARNHYDTVYDIWKGNKKSFISSRGLGIKAYEKIYNIFSNKFPDIQMELPYKGYVSKDIPEVATNQ